ncbi:MAG: flagellar biosynthetic protein FliP [Deltaproteobacteria bacterium]|nr:flagellar biosynthetic protein FliP [Deltaproteobacteria bacterium]
MATAAGFKYNPRMDPFSPYLAGLLTVILLSAFVKILTTLCILRYGIGLNNSGFGVVVVVFSFALTLFVMNPQLEALGIAKLWGESKAWPAAESIEREFRPFVEKHADQKVLQRLQHISEKLKPSAKEPPQAENETPASLAQDAGPQSFSVLIAAFLISELKEAFQLGFLFLVPFLVIDLLVTNILLVLGVTQLSQAVVALPLKILLFVAVDGWALVSEKLVSGYF